VDPLFELDLDRAAITSGVASRTLYLQLKTAIVDGRLRLGAKLPPTRHAKWRIAEHRSGGIRKTAA
jgi:GntR family transcriptional regulator/MocR family aminotransferase